jgi:hypothetical protein
MALCFLAQSYARVRAPKEEKVKESGKELHHLNIKDHREVFVKEKIEAIEVVDRGFEAAARVRGGAKEAYSLTSVC